MMFQRRFGGWRQYRLEFGLTEADEIDLHFGKRDRSQMTYAEAMAGTLSS